MRERSTYLPALSTFVCFCLLHGLRILVERYGGGLWVVAVEATAFVLALSLILVAMRERKGLWQRVRPRKLPRGAYALGLWLGLLAEVVALLLDLFAYRFTGLSGMTLTLGAIREPLHGIGLRTYFLPLAVIGALLEELYLRGTLLCMHERVAGTKVCIVLSGVIYAVLYGHIGSLPGAWLCGMAYAWLVCALGSLWPAVLAHLAGNLYYMFAAWLAETYAAFGIRAYFIGMNVLLGLLFAYLTLRKTEYLLKQGSLPHSNRGTGLHEAMPLLLDPGMIALVCAFLYKTMIYKG